MRSPSPLWNQLIQLTFFGALHREHPRRRIDDRCDATHVAQLLRSETALAQELAVRPDAELAHADDMLWVTNE
jgi:hypothetical protein